VRGRRRRTHHITHTTKSSRQRLAGRAPWGAMSATPASRKSSPYRSQLTCAHRPSRHLLGHRRGEGGLHRLHTMMRPCSGVRPRKSPATPAARRQQQDPAQARALRKHTDTTALYESTTGPRTLGAICVANATLQAQQADNVTRGCVTGAGQAGCAGTHARTHAPNAY
jgi:hypothetical protein